MSGLNRNSQCVFRSSFAAQMGEFALSMALFASAGLAVGSMRDIPALDLDAHTLRILTLGLPVPDSRPREPALIYGEPELHTE